MPHQKLTPVERADIPTFASEAEEADYWSTHQFGPELLGEMRPVADDPELVAEQDQLRAARDKRQQRASEEERVNMRWSGEQLSLVRAAAAQLGVPYQAYIKHVVMRQAQQDLASGTQARARSGSVSRQMN